MEEAGGECEVSEFTRGGMVARLHLHDAFFFSFFLMFRFCSHSLAWWLLCCIFFGSHTFLTFLLGDGVRALVVSSERFACY